MLSRFCFDQENHRIALFPGYVLFTFDVVGFQIICDVQPFLTSCSVGHISPLIFPACLDCFLVDCGPHQGGDPTGHNLKLYSALNTVSGPG